MLLYGTFEEKGYTFEAHIPDSDLEPMAFELRILKAGLQAFVFLVPMTYQPTFGVDVGDIQFLESILDRVLKILPESGALKDKHLLALRQLEEEVGGTELRSRHTTEQGLVGGEVGAFERTTNLFIAKFAPLLGGDEAMRQWMKKKLPQFNDHTPEEALRLGMTQDVVTFLLNDEKTSAKDSS